MSFLEIFRQRKPEKFVIPEHFRSPQEGILLEFAPEEIKKIERGISGAKFIKLKNDGAAVFKDCRKLARTNKEYRELLVNRERAAYLIDLFLGFGLVPPTVIRIIEGEIGSCQQFIENTKTSDEVDDVDTEIVKDEKLKMDLLDVILVNTDRNIGNWLIKEKKIYAIDHGYSLEEEKMFSDIWEGASIFLRPLPVETREKLTRFRSWTEGQTILKHLLSELLGESTAKGYIRRILVLAAAIQEDGFLAADKFNREIALDYA